MVPEQIAPGNLEVGVRERTAVAQRAKCGRGLGVEQASLGPLVGLLEVDARRVDAAQDVLKSPSHELALECGKTVRRWLEIREAANLHGSAETQLQLPAPLGQLRLHG